MKTTTKQHDQSYNSDSQRRTSEAVRSESEDPTHLAKISVAEDSLLAALDRLREGAGIRSQDVSDRIVCQAGGAILEHWQSKNKNAGEKIVTAANALAEMQPTNATETMLAAQMLAVNDAVFLFMSHATRHNALLEERNFSTEKACRFINLFVQQADCMMRLKGKTGRQKVTVEHVHVHNGGQAIVGAVTAGELDKGEGDGGTNR